MSRHAYASRDLPPSHSKLDQKLYPRVKAIFKNFRGKFFLSEYIGCFQAKKNQIDFFSIWNRYSVLWEYCNDDEIVISRMCAVKIAFPINKSNYTKKRFSP